VWVRVYFNCGTKPPKLATTNPDALKGKGPAPKGGPRLKARTYFDILRGQAFEQHESCSSASNRRASVADPVATHAS